MNHRSSFRLFSLIIFVIFLQAASLFVLIPRTSSHLGQLYNGDQYADGYDELAENLVAGHGYRFLPDSARTLTREPGYPLLLAGIFAVFGKNFAVVKLANMVLALGAAWLMTRIARKLSGNPLLIYGSPLLYLFHPGTLIAESRGGSEILFTFLLTLFILTVYRAFKSGGWQTYLVSGAALGLALLVRSTPIMFPIVLLVYLFIFDRKANPTFILLRNLTVMIIAMFVVLSPWIIRNYALTKKFVPTASVLGIAAQTGYYLSTHNAVGTDGLNRDAAQERNELASSLGYHFQEGYYQYFYSSADEVAFSQYLLKRVIDSYRKSPSLFFKVVGTNLFDFWCGGRNTKSEVMNAVVQFPLLVLAIMGVVIWGKNGNLKSVAPLGLIIIYIVSVSIPILSLARYSVPVLPFVSILACTTLAAAWQVYGSHPELTAATPGAVAGSGRSRGEVGVARTDRNVEGV